MRMSSWNVLGCRGKMQEITKVMEQLGIDIASITETKKKGFGSEVIGNYIHFCSGVPKENWAKRGVFSLFHKNCKHNITNWLCIDERIITVNINNLKTRFTFISVYGPNEDEPVVNKEFFYETFQRVITEFGKNIELVLIGDFNAALDAAVVALLLEGLEKKEVMIMEQD